MLGANRFHPNNVTTVLLKCSVLEATYPHKRFSNKQDFWQY